MKLQRRRVSRSSGTCSGHEAWWHMSLTWCTGAGGEAELLRGLYFLPTVQMYTMGLQIHLHPSFTPLTIPMHGQWDWAAKGSHLVKKQDRITAKDPRPPPHVTVMAFSVSIVSGRWNQVLVSGRWQIWRCGRGGKGGRGGGGGETCHLKTHAPLGGGVGKNSLSMDIVHWCPNPPMTIWTTMG